MILWVKTPKTGGTSILRQFKKIGLIPNKIHYSVPEKSDFIHHWKPIWRDMYRFTVVRNPFDKIVSAWKYLESTQNRSLLDVLNSLPDKKTNPNEWMHMTQSQTSAIADENGFIRYDKIVRFENLQSGINQVLRDNGIRPVKLIHINKSNRDPGYRQYYNKETRNIVEKKYWVDLELFNYEF